MSISLKEPLKSWLAKHVSANTDETTMFSIKLGARTEDGSSLVEIKIDLVWFLLLYVDEDDKIKLDVILELLQNKELALRFAATQDNPAAKRPIEEFLIFNFAYLNALKTFLNFNKLNLPIDFISHALFIKRSEVVDTREVNLIRLNTVSTVLETGFKLAKQPGYRANAAVLHKVLMMEDIDSIFAIAKSLLAAGYTLFNNSSVANSEVAIVLLNARENPDALFIIKQNASIFKTIMLHVAGANGDTSNLADYYYWVKEDMDTVHFIQKTLGIELSPST